MKKLIAVAAVLVSTLVGPVLDLSPLARPDQHPSASDWPWCC